MILSIPDMHELAARCAPSVAAETLLAVAKVESGFNPLAIGVNGRPAVQVRASDKADAVAKAATLIAQGRNVDLGLAQINSRNLAWLGLTVEAAFDPCRNLAASARVLQDGYGRGASKGAGEQPALLAALSYYNTGHPERGIRNGYVAKVTKAAATIVPALRPAQLANLAEAPAAEAEVEHPAWDVFGRARPPATFVIQISSAQSAGGQE